MIGRLIGIAICAVGISIKAWAVDSMYCPQNHGYINVGMTTDQVIAACGQPISKQQSRTPAMEQVPVQQLLYNAQGSPTAFYGVWSLPHGINSGAQLTFEIIDNKISAINLNGAGINAATICGGTSLQVGDPVAKVYSSCGNPSIVNNTYINQPIQSEKKPEIWTYQVDKYQAPFTLTFIDGALHSIN